MSSDQRAGPGPRPTERKPREAFNGRGDSRRGGQLTSRQPGVSRNGGSRVETRPPGDKNSFRFRLSQHTRGGSVLHLCVNFGNLWDREFTLKSCPYPFLQRGIFSISKGTSFTTAGWLQKVSWLHFVSTINTISMNGQLYNMREVLAKEDL